MRVLKLRMKGLTQAEIARKFKTTRANISILESRARDNIERAERTLKLAEKLRAPVVISIEPGEDILQVPKRIFQAADAAKIKVHQGTAEIIAKINKDAEGKIHGRSATKGFDIALNSDGEILIS